MCGSSICVRIHKRTFSFEKTFPTVSQNLSVTGNKDIKHQVKGLSKINFTNQDRKDRNDGLY